MYKTTDMTSNARIVKPRTPPTTAPIRVAVEVVDLETRLSSGAGGGRYETTEVVWT